MFSLLPALPCPALPCPALPARLSLCLSQSQGEELELRRRVRSMDAAEQLLRAAAEAANGGGDAAHKLAAAEKAHFLAHWATHIAQADQRLSVIGGESTARVGTGGAFRSRRPAEFALEGELSLRSRTEPGAERVASWDAIAIAEPPTDWQPAEWIAAVAEEDRAAAVRIQARHRGIMVRRGAEQEQAAALRIQAHRRGFLARRNAQQEFHEQQARNQELIQVQLRAELTMMKPSKLRRQALESGMADAVADGLLEADHSGATLLEQIVRRVAPPPTALAAESVLEKDAKVDNAAARGADAFKTPRLSELGVLLLEHVRSGSVHCQEVAAMDSSLRLHCGVVEEWQDWKALVELPLGGLPGQWVRTRPVRLRTENIDRDSGDGGVIAGVQAGFCCAGSLGIVLGPWRYGIGAQIVAFEPRSCACLRPQLRLGLVLAAVGSARIADHLRYDAVAMLLEQAGVEGGRTLRQGSLALTFVEPQALAVRVASPVQLSPLTGTPRAEQSAIEGAGDGGLNVAEPAQWEPRRVQSLMGRVSELFDRMGALELECEPYGAVVQLQRMARGFLAREEHFLRCATHR
eukprot:SAG11_NODE_687_length_7719_cov_1.975328_3_plen_578_part_00